MTQIPTQICKIIILRICETSQSFICVEFRLAMQLQHLLPHQLKLAVDEGWPLLVPAGCIEYHGPHLPLGVDTLVVEELCRRVAARTKAVVAPPFWYGPTGYAVTGPDKGTVDVSTERFGRHAKDVLAAFWDIGFKWIVDLHPSPAARGTGGAGAAPGCRRSDLREIA